MKPLISVTFICALTALFMTLATAKSATACSVCVSANCQNELHACQPDATCAAFATCWTSCTIGACIESCAASNPSSLTDDLLACMTVNCGAQCGLPATSLVPSISFGGLALLGGLVLGIVAWRQRRPR